MTRARRRKWFKRVTLAFAGLVGVAFVVSAYGYGRMCNSGRCAAIVDGRVCLSLGTGSARGGWSGYTVRGSRVWCLYSLDGTSEWYVDIDSPGTICFPLWPLAIASGCLVFAAWWGRMFFVPRGHCRVCLYDLRGLSATGSGVVCPECGTLHTQARDFSNGSSAAGGPSESPPRKAPVSP